MDQNLLLDLYKSMLKIRRFEEEAARLYTERKIAGFLHLYIGQEAIAVGTASVLEKGDYVMSGYRCHGHYLALGGNVAAGFGELLGKETGCAKGRGGSMHFYDIENGFLGGWGIVGAQVPVAAGVAFAKKYQGTRSVCVCFLGDGAINIGPFHEGLALAALWKIPVVYVIENNYFSMGTPLEKTSATDDLSIRALGYPMARDTVDGHDVFAVRSALHSAITRARENQLPTLIEARTYRYRGHSMSDPATYRTKDDVQKWKDRDPITTLGAKLDGLGLSAQRIEIENGIEAEIAQGLSEAEAAAFPHPDTVMNYIYA